MRIHVQRTVSRCFAALRQLRQIRRYVPATTFQIVALVHSRLDYGNSGLVGIQAYLLRPLALILPELETDLSIEIVIRLI